MTFEIKEEEKGFSFWSSLKWNPVVMIGNDDIVGVFNDDV
jgi:hypothetical protein